MKDDTIIPFSSGEVAIIRKARSRRKHCSEDCRRIEVDFEKRRIECRDCHQEVDPFDYIGDWAKKSDQRMSGLKELDERIRLKRQEAEAMEREYRRIRGQLDRLDRPARKRVQQAMFDQKYNPHLGPQVLLDSVKESA